MKLNNLAHKLAVQQTIHPWRFLIVTVVVTIIAGIIASGLKFDSGYEALLPKDAPEIANADMVREKTGGTRQIVVAIKGEDPAARLEFGRKLAPLLRNLDKIRCVDLEFPVDFFADRAMWMMSVEALDKLLPALKEAVRIAKWQANPMALHLDEEEEKAELEAAWSEVDEIAKSEKGEQPFDEVLTSEDGQYTFMLVVPAIKFSDMKAGRRLLEAIHAQIDSLNPSAAGLEVRTAGNLDVIQEQNQTMRSDLSRATTLTLICGILLVATFTRRVGAPFVIGYALVAGVTWTFAVARLSIGHVNIITGFLGGIIIGLGIDFGVHLFVRYQQELRILGGDRKQACIRAVVGTLPPALTSALTTAFTFLSFTIADFRGFSEFGFLAGVGVLFTLISSFLILPPLLLVTKRGRATAPVKTNNFSISKPIAIMVVVVVGITTIFGGLHATDIPFRNNFAELRGKSQSTEFLDYVDKNLGIGFNPAVLLAPDLESAAKIEELALGMSKTEGSRINRVFSLVDLLPKQIDEHRTRIEKLRKILADPKLDRAEKKEGDRAKQLADARRMIKTEPWTTEDLPEVFSRRSTTLDKKQLLVFAWPNVRNDSDTQAVSWENELDQLSAKIKAAGINNYSMADETLILAWTYKLVVADGPRLLGVAIVVVFLLLIIDFRSLRHAAFVSVPLAVGMLIFVAIAWLLDMELNMYNVIVVPSVIGIGIDNAVHIYHRYRIEGKGSAGLVMRYTGIAALLASMTTAIGFGSALISHSLGLRSMGSLAVVGISATFLAAVIFFPCLLSLMDSKKSSK